MENFIIDMPVKVHFGKNATENIGEIASQYGKKALIIYGGGSIKRNGIHDKITTKLKESGIDFVEFSGIKPNPVFEDVNKAVKSGISEKADMIISIGGGSVIDSAKIASVCLAQNSDAWNITSAKVESKKAVPHLAVLTLAATGTEMNPFAVLQNQQTKEKIGFKNPLLFPKHSFLNPEFTFSVSRSQTANGIVDLIAHSLEAFFAGGENPLADRFVCSIIKEAIDFSEELLENPNDYQLRARMMWAATNALNGTAYYGRKFNGDWGVHAIGHVLSIIYDLAHGQTLSIAYPAWMDFYQDKLNKRILFLGKEIFEQNSAKETITAFTDFFKKIGSPIHLCEVGVEKSEKEKIVSLMQKNRVSGLNHKIELEEISELVERML